MKKLTLTCGLLALSLNHVTHSNPLRALRAGTKLHRALKNDVIFSLQNGIDFKHVETYVKNFGHRGFKDLPKHFRASYNWTRLRNGNEDLPEAYPKTIKDLQVIIAHIQQKAYFKQQQEKFWDDEIQEYAQRKHELNTQQAEGAQQRILFLPEAKKRGFFGGLKNSLTAWFNQK